MVTCESPSCLPDEGLANDRLCTKSFPAVSCLCNCKRKAAASLVQRGKQSVQLLQAPKASRVSGGEGDCPISFPCASVLHGELLSCTAGCEIGPHGWFKVCSIICSGWQIYFGTGRLSDLSPSLLSEPFSFILFSLKDLEFWVLKLYLSVYKQIMTEGISHTVYISGEEIGKNYKWHAAEST